MPVWVAFVFAHEVFFDVEGVGREVSDVAPLAIGDRADGIGRAFGEVVVHPEGIVAVIGVLAVKNRSKTRAVELFGCRFSSGEIEESGKNVGVLHDGFGAGGSDFSRPASDERSVETVVPIGPLTTGELSTLLAGEKDEGVVGEFGFIKESEEFADLGIHVGDLGEVVGVLLPRHRGVGEI